jgi:uncharacterized membrane protein YadS
MGILKTNSRKLWVSLLSILIIVLSVIIIEGSKQYQKSVQGKRSKPNFWIGFSLYIIGWIALVYSIISDKTLKNISIEDKKTWFVVASSFLVMGSVLIVTTTEFLKGSMQKWAMWLIIPLIVGYLGLGWSTGLESVSKVAKWVGLGAGILIVLGILLARRWQQKRCIIFGPGLPLYVFGFIVIAVINALV